MQTGQKLQALRVQRGMTQEQLAVLFTIFGGGLIIIIGVVVSVVSTVVSSVASAVDDEED